MKKWMTGVLALLMVCSLVGCGSKSQTETVDLSAFYQDLVTEYGWDDNGMVEMNEELLDSYYPGLKDLSTKQMIVKMPQMSSVVNEFALVECETEDDAKKAAEIFQKRIDDQANGGAWYPDSMEAWSNAQVYTEKTYAAMIASAEHQDEIGDKFTALFA